MGPRLDAQAHCQKRSSKVIHAEYENDKVISIDQLMVLTGLGKNSIRRLMEKREIPFIRLSQRRIGFRMRSIQAWLNERENSHRRTSTSEGISHE
jgi:predicted DNA-binding transcriptional regulator AlpA